MTTEILLPEKPIKGEWDDYIYGGKALIIKRGDAWVGIYNMNHHGSRYQRGDKIKSGELLLMCLKTVLKNRKDDIDD